MTFLASIDLNQPGTFYSWSIFTVSEANLIVIGVMVLIFGLALLVPFPKGSVRPGTPPDVAAEAPTLVDLGDPEDAKMWTARIRRRALKHLPPHKLLPDRQPAYVASWIYVFGVASLAALAVVIASGFAIVIGGVDWWHYNSVGHFFNSLHLWSVELFMAFIVIHLWGKFWMAAWRGKRALTWMTGVVAFMAAVIECFTGYLSQQNFDSQWISTNGKDAINATGLGGFFNLLNFGQMLTWHIVLVPIVLIAIVGAHVLLVRVRGVSHPLPAKRPHDRPTRKAARVNDRSPWAGPTRRYDIVKEGTAASLVVLLVVVFLAWALSSPDVPPVTIQSWAHVAPADFIGTAANELAGTTETANYGPPYNNGTNNVQSILFSPQKLAGVLLPVDAAQDFVINPLRAVAGANAVLTHALDTYEAAPEAQQMKWLTAYINALPKVTFKNGVPSVPTNAAGPVPVLMSEELAVAQSGGLDSELLAQVPFYGTNFTKPLLFLEDGSYFGGLAQQAHLTGSQWGVMNETGSYPGQPWLWLYTLWYQVPGWKTSSNIDLIAIYMTGLATILLLLVPFIPGLRDIPRFIPIHRLVWRKWGESEADVGPGAPPGAPPVVPTDVWAGGPPGMAPPGDPAGGAPGGWPAAPQADPSGGAPGGWPGAAPGTAPGADPGGPPVAPPFGLPGDNPQPV
jgi:hypothetical protein